MAGGRGKKQRGNLDRTHQWPCHYRLSPSKTLESFTNKTFKERQRIEKNHTAIKNVINLQVDILRLLYSNLDLSQEEQLIVDIILNSYSSQSVKDFYTNDTPCKESLSKRYPVHCYNVQQELEEVKSYAVVNTSPTSSEMADSGLETGSVSPHDNTVSEHSSTDLEESQVAEYASASDDLDKIKRTSEKDKPLESEQCAVRSAVEAALKECTLNEDGAIRSPLENQQLDSSSSSTENPRKENLQAHEIFQYENQVLSEPFYESDCGSDENESFEFIDPANVVPTNDTEEEPTKNSTTKTTQTEEILTRYAESKGATAESTDSNTSLSKEVSNRNSTSSNYYFIDASTLNDEIEVVTTSSLDSSVKTAQSNNSRPANGEQRTVCDTTEDRTCKFTSLKTTNFPTGHENVAEFERELKLTEYLEPLEESRKVRRVDSTSDDAIEALKGADKESLAIEIKEADSEESSQPSPYPENNKDVNNEKQEAKKMNNDDAALHSKNKESSDENTTSTENNPRGLLIRRNTFELDSDEEKLSLLRQEYERRQGNLVFQSAIPQYSGHRVDGDSCFNPSLEPVALPVVLPVADVITSNTLSQYNPDDQLPVSQYRTSQPSTSKCKYDVSQKQTENNYVLQTTIPRGSTVYPVTKSASDKSVADYYADSDDTSQSCANSLPVSLSCITERENRVDPTKRTKRDEATPIISGGVSTSDYSKPTDSPTVRRKTESTPIVSGGSVIMREPEIRMKPTRMSSSMTAWVVDMSDCTKSDLKSSASPSSHSGMSQSFSNTESIKKPERKCNSNDKHGSLGFFVNLKDMDAKPSVGIKKDVQKQESAVIKKEQNGTDKAYCEFYIDISKKDNSSKIPKKDEKDIKFDTGAEKLTESTDKKNIFSMFIDLNEPHKTVKNDTKSNNDKKSLLPFSERRIETKQDDVKSSETSTISNSDTQLLEEQKSGKERSKPSVFMFIESDSPVVRRRTLSSSRPAFKRHSWNVDKSQNNTSNGHVAKELMFRKEHKRAHSLSVDRNELRRLQAKPSSSSHSLSEAARAEPLIRKNAKTTNEQDNSSNNNMDTSTEDVFEFDVRDTPPNSHIEIINEELRVSVKRHDYKELVANEGLETAGGTDSKIYEDEYSELSAWDKTGTESTEGPTRKSETFDISSGSGPSPESDNHEYELSDLLNGEAPNMPERPQIVPPVTNKISETHKSLNETIKKIECELKCEPEYEKVTTSYDGRTTSKAEVKMDAEKGTCSNFVRLSDLDKTPGARRVSDLLMAKEDRATCRMSNSIPETSWIESKLVISRTNGPVRTLSKKFPSVMSTSLPPKQKSPLEDLTGECEAEGIVSESDLSSMQSSMGRSGAEGSTEETETSSLVGAKPYNRLGEDLLRMFLEEINPDVTIDVAGRRIRAHKCILSSRCQYFAAILSGGWIESAGNVISLQGYSYNAVYFALCHIYSGESNIPDSISIVELATLADMLCLEGLKEVIGYTLKVKYCHLFHKPCQICAVGVLECMPLAAAYGLDEVYRKSLRWITRHFVRIWPCKAFATLPRELMEKCYHQHIVHMSTDNVLQTMMDCDKLLATLPNVRWAEPVFRMVSNLLETSVKFLSDNFSGVLGNENFQSLGRELTWNISRLEDNFLAAAERLPPEQACKSYSKLHKMLLATQTDDSQIKAKWGPLFIEFLRKIQVRVEKCLVRDAARAARTTTWLKMDLELRRRIQELACLVILPHETTKRQSRHSNFLKEPRTPSERQTTSRSLDLKRVKMVISEHNDKTMKQVTGVQQTKKVLNKPKSDPLERKMPENKQVTNDTTIRPKSWPNKVEVKSRYLEPRNKSVPKESVQQVHQEKVTVQQRRKIMISSSDSSRTSSPAMKRASDKKPLAKLKLPVKKDVKALSSDSLAESNPNRANNRKDLISKSCGITRPESPSFKQKGSEMGLSVDSLADSKSKPTPTKKKVSGKMDTSMSTDSLMTEITATPKSNASNKLSPTMTKGVTKTQSYERVKKSSPPTQQRSPLTATRRTPRSLESSTAASRSRAAAISAYHGSPSLRRNLLDAAKTPDIAGKSLNNVASRTASARQLMQLSTISANAKKERGSNTQSSESPSKKSSPKLSGTNRQLNKPAIAGKRPTLKATDDKVKAKCHNGEAPAAKQPTVGSRSGTFLKDEPTILKKADIKASHINT